MSAGQHAVKLYLQKQRYSQSRNSWLCHAGKEYWRSTSAKAPLLSSGPLCSRSCSSSQGISARMLSWSWLMCCSLNDWSTFDGDWHIMLSDTSDVTGVQESVSWDVLLSPFGELRKLGSCFKFWTSQSLALCRSIRIKYRNALYLLVWAGVQYWLKRKEIQVRILAFSRQHKLRLMYSKRLYQNVLQFKL